MPSPPSAPSAGTELTAGPWGHGGICASRRDDGLMVLVSGAIPGERVRVEVTEQRRTYARGSVIEVLEAAPSRVRPPWPEGAALGVTDLGHVAPISARQAKGEVVTGLLAQIGGIAWPVEVEPVGTGAALGWRTKIELTVAADGRAGMYSRRSETLVPLAAMPLAVPELAALGLFERRWPVGSRLTAVAPSAGTPFCLVDGSPADRVRREAVCVRG
ncbi:MAG: TRAM domain-containing protein, partial [Bifidobacteriaceae bacterium]|nr:TRAM domain-containing protein [Bifidobacteriaceae bacterium]